MKLEDQLRGYRSVLDAETEARAADAQANHAVVPIRVRPARTLIVAAVAVAAAVAIAFAVVGTTSKRSTPPVGETTTRPSSTTSPPATTEITVPHAVGSPLTLPVTVCQTQQGLSPSPTDPHAPATITIATPPFTTPTLAAYSGTRGYLIVTAPAGWKCTAVEATDGGQRISVSPSGSDTQPGSGGSRVSDGIYASTENACQGCVYYAVCGIVPTAAADFPAYASQPCRRPDGETVIDRGHGVYEFDDPAGTFIGVGATRSVLRYAPPTAQSDGFATRESCVLPAAQEASVCDTLFAEFLSLQPTPWNQASLTISPRGLGAVDVGMNLVEAESSAGETFDGAGDGFYYSTAHDRTGLHLFVGFAVNGTKVACVGAEFWTGPHPTQVVRTPEGVALGDSVERLLAVYGSRAKYVPAPPAGMTTNAGYVVQEDGGAIALSVYHGRVTELAGGDAHLTPNTCTG